MNRREHILEHLREELGFASHLLGGAKTVLAQIDRFLATHEVPDDIDLHRQPALWNRLIAEVVVPETSFFRYPESFLALGQWVATRGRRSVRALCLPCSTGEEAWSMAMTLREAGITNFQIEAADASSRSVTHAGIGSYPERSVRGLPAGPRERWFTSIGQALVVAEDLRRFVVFRTANAFSFHAEPGCYDVIFCRNLLIYFDVENQHRLFQRLAAWLHPEGVLFLGPGEATVAASHGWKSTGRTMSFSFVRGETRPATSVKSRPPSGRKLSARSVAGPVTSIHKPAAPLVAEVDWLVRATEFADLGRFAEATAALEKFHAQHPPSSKSLLLRGIVEEASGQRARAESDYRKTLYLEPDHPDALLHLCLLLESDGRAPAARPFRRRLDRLSAP